ncbi:MAG: guanylate kinase [Gemmatimonadetes bacterium]|nr:MAG: guanylate kinase [Gemmatimonadota bacterium]
MTPRIVVLSAPSGGGKTTIAKAVRERYPDRFGFSVSATTRKPRRGEQDGVDYHFWKPSAFLEAVNQGKFLEHAEYAGELYGTLKSDVKKILGSGRHVLLDIEVRGAEQVRQLEPNATTIFILPSDPRVLIQRLVHRGSESPQEIQRRLERAIYELGHARNFNRWIRNDDLEDAVRAVVQSVEQSPVELSRDEHDFAWLNRYLDGIQVEKQRLYDNLDQQKG